MNNKIYKAKQEWLEKVMASDLPLAQKVFAFSIYKRAYGTKVESFPDTETIKEDTGLASSKFPAYRRALISADVLTAKKVRRGKFKQENYVYTLNLNWDGHVPTGNEPCTQREQAIYPAGTSHVPTGDSNTISNTTIDTTSKTTIDAPVVAYAPPVPSSSSRSEIKEGYEYLGSLEVETFEDFSNSRDSLTFDYLANSEGVAVFDSLAKEEEAVVKEFDRRSAADWRDLRRTRPLTKEENDFINAKASAYNAERRAREEAAKVAMALDDDW